MHHKYDMTLKDAFNMVGDIYRYIYRQIRVYLQVHLASIASYRQLQQQLWS